MAQLDIEAARLRIQRKPTVSTPGRKPYPDRESKGRRLCEMLDQDMTWEQIYPAANNEFGTAYKFAENGTLQKLARAYRLSIKREGT